MPDTCGNTLDNTRTTRTAVHIFCTKTGRGAQTQCDHTPPNTRHPHSLSATFPLRIPAATPLFPCELSALSTMPITITILK
jgi:hypothetical protein